MFFIVLLLSILIQLPCSRQTKRDNNTINHNKFISIIYDINYSPFESRNFTPKNHFIASRDEIVEIENEFLKLYGSAIDNHQILFYDDYKLNHSQDMTEEAWMEATKHKDNRKKYAADGEKQLKKEINDFDWSYYGYFGFNSMRNLRIVVCK